MVGVVGGLDQKNVSCPLVTFLYFSTIKIFSPLAQSTQKLSRSNLCCNDAAMMLQ